MVIKNLVGLYTNQLKSFQYCKSLKSIIIPSNVTFIGNFAFYFCSSLESITLPSSVTSIGSFVFNDCHSLQEIIIPLGSRAKFEKLLPIYKDKLIEK